mmetsp:Transcript_47349/g.122345  ORF Transcript_47349/g.122345 Transcript_47349/m.122345 type:complete len:432 (-) Transcript_47349:466-1761(-)
MSSKPNGQGLEPDEHAMGAFSTALSQVGKGRASDVLRNITKIKRESPLGVARKYKVQTTLSFVMMLIGAMVSLFLMSLQERDFDNLERRRIQAAAIPYAESLRVSVESNVGAAFALAAMFGVDEVMTNVTRTNFDTVAEALLKTTRGITNLQVAPCAIVAQIHPLAGSEAAIGHNLVQDPDRALSTLDTIAARRLTFIGPLTLLQGGTAIVGRVPIYLSDQNSSQDARCAFNFYGLPTPGDFWGFATMLSTLDDLLQPVHLDELFTQLDMDYQLVAPWGGQEVLVHSSPGYGSSQSTADFRDQGARGSSLAEFFQGEYEQGGAVQEIPVEFGRDANIRFATWTLRVRPKGGWPSNAPRLPWMIVVLVISVANGLIGTYISLAVRLQLNAWTTEIFTVMGMVDRQVSSGSLEMQRNSSEASIESDAKSDYSV